MTHTARAKNHRTGLVDDRVRTSLPCLLPIKIFERQQSPKHMEIPLLIIRSCANQRR